jgi:hypothetical protein
MTRPVHTPLQAGRVALALAVLVTVKVLGLRWMAAMTVAIAEPSTAITRPTTAVAADPEGLTTDPAERPCVSR